MSRWHHGRMHRIRIAAAVLVVALTAGSAGAQPPRYDQHVALFGNLHAHSSLSRDVHPEAGEDLSPRAAFAYARAHGLDFLAITDHHKAVDARGPTLRMTDDEYRTQLYDVAMQVNSSPGRRFVAIPGIEWGNIATGNHVNVFGASSLPPASIRDVEYDRLYAWAREHARFVQFNHPNSWSGATNRRRDVGNFGRARYPSVQAFVDAVDPIVSTVSIITTVHGGHLSGRHRRSEERTHRAMQWERYYRELLNTGMHIAPAANQDTHWRNWGTVTAARTGAWAARFDYDALMDAFRANRVYATEDDELVVFFRVEHAGRRHWMGETVTLTQDEVEVELLVRVWQADGVREGPYTVQLVSDADGVGGREAAVWDTFEVREAQLVRRRVPVVAGEYFYLIVSEQNGRDNLVGDGDDEVNNATGEHGADGLRDDPNHSAWTSPVWFRRAG